MKRHKRKRSSKAASPAKIPVDAEKPAETLAALAEADHVVDLGDEFIATVEKEKAAGPSVALAAVDHGPVPRDELTTAVDVEKPAETRAALAGIDRRTHPRYEFTAAVEVVAAESGARIETRVRDLS